MGTSDHATRVELDGREITIIGTAHVSQQSVEEVRTAIMELAPDTVCVELDQGRYDALLDADRFRNLNLKQILLNRRVWFTLASLMLAAYQKKIGDKLGVRPGAELLAAIESSKAVGARVVLADRNIQTTLRRTWANISGASRAQLVLSLVAAPLATTDVSADQVESLKGHDTISEMLNELSQQVPGLKEPLIDERDQYLADSVSTAGGRRVIAVVGAGHVQGILSNLGKPLDRARLEEVPPRSLYKRVARYCLPTLVAALFFVATRHGTTSAIAGHMLRVWVLCTGIGCAASAAIGRAHPLTILVAAITAPWAVLVPQLGAGMLPALTENALVRPSSDHRAAILQDVGSLRSALRNPAARVLLLFAMASLGALLGAMIGAVWLTLLVWFGPR